jgi:ribosome assembly protein 4
VQVDPIKRTLKAPGTWRLILKCDKLLSNFAFNFNLRRYGMDKDVRLWDPTTGLAAGGPMKGHRKHITALAWLGGAG